MYICDKCWLSCVKESRGCTTIETHVLLRLFYACLVFLWIKMRRWKLDYYHCFISSQWLDYFFCLFFIRLAGLADYRKWVFESHNVNLFEKNKLKKILKVKILPGRGETDLCERQTEHNRRKKENWFNVTTHSSVTSFMFAKFIRSKESNKNNVKMFYNDHICIPRIPLKKNDFFF